MTLKSNQLELGASVFVQWSLPISSEIGIYHSCKDHDIVLQRCCISGLTSCLSHDFVTTWWLFSCLHCPLHFCFVQASTVITLLQQLLTLLSVIFVPCLVYMFNISLLIFHIFLFYVRENHFRHWGRGWCRQTCLSPPVIHYWPFQGGGSDVVLCCLFLVSEIRWCFTLCMFIILLVRFGLLSDHLLGNSCPLG